MKKIIYLFIFFIVIGNAFSGKYPNIRISSPNNIDPNEVCIAINPLNPNHIVGGANLKYFYYSYDGGKTWKQTELESQFGVWGDPCIVFDNEANIYFAHLSNPKNGAWIDRIVVQQTDNNGFSWQFDNGVGHTPGKQQDKEWMAVDRSNSKYKNNIYMTWTEFDKYGSKLKTDSTRILFSLSTDYGETWAKPLVISDIGGDCIDNDSTVEGAVPCVGPNGEVYVAWAGHNKIYFDKSTDAGQTWGKDVFVADQIDGWTQSIPGILRCNGLPVTACDISNSKYRGNIYIMFADSKEKDNSDIFLCKSTDNGATWSEPKKVNTDTSKRHQFFPWMAVDPSSGNIYIVFYDRRETIGNATDVYLARSTDGGDTFFDFPISDSSFIPNSSVFFGDYSGIDAFNGKVFPIWGRMDNNKMSIWTAIIDEKTNASIDNNELNLSCYPNPLHQIANISFNLLNESNIKLEIVSTQGQIIEVLCNEFAESGAKSFSWDASKYSQGVYFYRLWINNQVIIKSCIKL